MPLPVVVPDASVLLKWVLPEDEEPEANKSLLLRAAIVGETIRAIVPTLWIYEVGNTIARRFPNQASDWLSALVKFGLSESRCSQRWLSKTLELAHRHGVPGYFRVGTQQIDSDFIGSLARLVRFARDTGAGLHAAGDMMPCAKRNRRCPFVLRASLTEAHP